MTTPTILRANVTEDSDGIHVSPVWSGVDRAEAGGWGLSATPKNRVLAGRLARAVEAGVVFHDIGVQTDVNSKTFATHSCRVLGRTMNADLKKLGF